MPVLLPLDQLAIFARTESAETYCRVSICELRLNRKWTMQENNNPEHTSHPTTEQLQQVCILLVHSSEKQGASCLRVCPDRQTSLHLPSGSAHQKAASRWPAYRGWLPDSKRPPRAHRISCPGKALGQRRAASHRTCPACCPVWTRCWNRSLRSWCWRRHPAEGSPPESYAHQCKGGREGDQEWDRESSIAGEWGGRRKYEKVGGCKRVRDRWGRGGGACVSSNNTDTGHDSYCIYVTESV